MTEQPRRILYLRPDSMGDALLSAPLLEALARRWPGAELTVVCQERLANLYEACPHVTRLIPFDRAVFQPGHGGLERLLRRIAQEKADLAVHPVYSREFHGDLMVAASGAAVRVGFEGDLSNVAREIRAKGDAHYTALVPSEGEGRSELERLRDFMAHLDLDIPPALGPRLWTTPGDEAFVARRLGELGDPGRALAFFPGAQYAPRIYPAYREALEGFLERKGMTLVALGSPGERGLAASILKDLPGRHLNLCGEFTLRQVGAALRQCRMALGAESGLAHMACAVGTAQVVVLGGGHFGRFMPYSPLTTAVSLPLDCYFCNWRCPFERPFCIRDLDPRVVAHALERAYEGPGALPRLVLQSRGFEEGRPLRLDLGPLLDRNHVDVVTVDPSGPLPEGREEALPPPERPRTTVICAVWHRDPGRLDLLRGHQACLDAQTVPVDRVYVFDGGDTPPPWLKGRILAAREPLGLYEAWNAALPLVRTPYVMNLNLDDRLNVDAVVRLERALDLGADLAGGDWRICFTQSETDAVGPCEPARDLPCHPEWPPRRTTRLGSGTGDRGTYGPACAWRMDLHGELPRFPWRFQDGSPIRILGDAAWWTLLLARHKHLERLPVILGRYSSHPGDQAEFREAPDQEREKLRNLGPALS
jgi:ADP-heptose:LPS heptosyltransferase